MYHNHSNNETCPPKSQEEVKLSHSSSSESTSQNNNDLDRPKIQVAPRGIGPVTDLHENDVLCGRGGRINGHYGNIQFRKICAEKRVEYFTLGIKKIQKAHIAASVVERIRSLDPPGRFLKQDKSGWFDIGCAKAMTKVGQAIREHTPKEEDSTFGGMPTLGQRQWEGSTVTGFNSPLYPGYSSIQVKRPQPSEPTLATQLEDQFTPLPANSNSGVFHNTIRGATREHFGQPVGNTTSYAINHDSSEHPFGRNFMNNPPLALPARSEKRLSTMSALSGISRMSDLMRSSVQSNFSDNGRMSINNRKSTDSLLRQSIMSDMSDCMSVMSINDVGYGKTVDECLMAQGDMDMRLSLATPAPSPLQANMISDDTDAKVPGAPEGRWQNRKNSLFSMSMGSTISNVSFGSANSFSFL